MKTKLLIVDDSSVSRMIIRGRIATLQPGWDVMEACSGDEAVAMVSTAQPDYITMDVNMPGMNGFEAARKIRQLHADIRIVMLTANIQASSRDKAAQLAVHFVQKPATQSAIQEVIDYFLARP
ncbi:MAG: response regulator [Burkholderiales bacterium]|nr:response regulator [Burkholderiales bacterium]